MMKTLLTKWRRGFGLSKAIIRLRTSRVCTRSIRRFWCNEANPKLEAANLLEACAARVELVPFPVNSMTGVLVGPGLARGAHFSLQLRESLALSTVERGGAFLIAAITSPADAHKTALQPI